MSAPITTLKGTLPTLSVPVPIQRKKRITIFDLPRELRQQIFVQVFEPSCTSLVHWKPKNGPLRNHRGKLTLLSIINLNSIFLYERDSCSLQTIELREAFPELTDEIMQDVAARYREKPRMVWDEELRKIGRTFKNMHGYEYAWGFRHWKRELENERPQ